MTVGVAARNEEATIEHSLRSIDDALTELPGDVTVEVIVAVNGSTDQTRQIADDHATGRTHYRVIETDAGLVEAQRAIARAADTADYLIFVDADCLLDRHCLRVLAEVMEDRTVQATWATRALVGPTRPGFWRGLLNFGDYHPDVILRGHYLVGQAFAIRRYDVPYGSPHREPQPAKVVTHLQLDRGPLTDDSYLSRSLIAGFGREAIRPAAGAIVYSHPMRSLRDLYRAQRRKAYEVERLNMLFPELRTIRGKHFGRRIDAAAYARLSRIARLQCRLYLPLYANLWRLAQWQLAASLRLLRWGVPLRPCDIWPVVEGTKKPFPAT
ncbi:glycosyltransferase family 2 protein [Asanoa sp. NPDC049573]|uniref:glycosyltransferase n=1 Tax=Asanoa sp. NPDC049573 TaxID=3155396 RepID=UPI003448C5F7